MAGVTVTVEGTDLAIKGIKGFCMERKRKIEKSMIAGGMIVNREAKQLCPVKTGRLRGSLSVNWSGSGLANGDLTPGGNEENPQMPSDGVEEPVLEQGEGFIVLCGTNVSYAEDVEARSPYLWPAFAIHRQEIIEMILKSVKEA